MFYVLGLLVCLFGFFSIQNGVMNAAYYNEVFFSQHSIGSTSYISRGKLARCMSAFEIEKLLEQTRKYG